MPRRLRLSSKKNWERKKQASKKLPVTTTEMESTDSSTLSSIQISSSSVSSSSSKVIDSPSVPTSPAEVIDSPSVPSLSSEVVGNSSVDSSLPAVTDVEPTHTTVEELHQSLQLPNRSWCDQSTPGQIRLCKISTTSVSVPPVITHCLTVDSSLKWSLFVHNRMVSKIKHSTLGSFPDSLTSDSLHYLLQRIDDFNVCLGQPDRHFIDMASARKGMFKSNDGSISAILDEYAPLVCNHEVYRATIRSAQCELVTSGVKCKSCQMYRPTLRKLYTRWSERSSRLTDASSHTNFRYLNTPEKKEKVAQLKRRVVVVESEVRKLQAKIENLTQQLGNSVDSGLHGDLLDIMKENTPEMEKAFPEGSFKRLFWQEQLRAASKKDARQVRWHPLIVRWCLNLKLMSSSAYHAMRTAGFISLPSERTLRDYSNHFKCKTGFQLEVNEQLYKEAKVEELQESKKFCGILIDEMKIKENLVYDKYSGEIIGFTQLGEINNELQKLEQDCRSDTDHPAVAKHLLVLMVRGIFFKLDFPYAHFATEAATADLLHPIIWEAIRHVESIGLKVIFITADGASSNRRFFRMHRNGGETPTYKTKNPYSEDGSRWIYFISDTPHLIKTTRNCLSHSGDGGTRLMTRNGQFLLWKHLRDLNEKISGMAVRSNGLSLLPKLKLEHFNLTSYSRMRVDLAAQVLSTSVADALAYFGDPATKETEYFVRQFDRLFDCLNVRSLSEWVHKKKPDLKPYTSPEDSRLEWLEKDFLTYISNWKSAIQKTDFEAKEKAKMGLSAETTEGLLITVKSFVEMVRYLLSQPGAEDLFFLSERISQDPLENYFGKQRSRGRRCDNPSLKECLQNSISIRAQKSLELDRVQGNCRRKRRLLDSDLKIDSTPLPKRKRQKVTNSEVKQ